MSVAVSLIALFVAAIGWIRAAALDACVDELATDVDALGTRVVELERRLGSAGCRACSPTTRLVRERPRE